MQSLADIIEWSKQHADLELPPGFDKQDDLIKAQEDNSDMELVAQATIEVRNLGTATLNKVFDEHNMGIIAAPDDSAMAIWPAAAAYPSAIVPYRTLKSNGRPFGMLAVARAREEGKLVNFMSVWEVAFPDRPLPKPLMKDERISVV